MAASAEVCGGITIHHAQIDAASIHFKTRVGEWWCISAEVRGGIVVHHPCMYAWMDGCMHAHDHGWLQNNKKIDQGGEVVTRGMDPSRN